MAVEGKNVEDDGTCDVSVGFVLVRVSASLLALLFQSHLAMSD